MLERGSLTNLGQFFLLGLRLGPRGVRMVLNDGEVVAVDILILSHIRFVLSELC